MDDPIEVVSAPELPKAVQLDESAELRVLAGQTSYLAEAKKAKPDFLDVDKDGDKKEPMKKAVKDKEEVKEEMKVGDTKKTAKGGTITKTATGIRHQAAPGVYGGSDDKDTDPDADDKDAPANKGGKAKKAKKESIDTDAFKAKFESMVAEKKSYSAKKAAAGKDIGQPGKNFEKIAKKAGKEYGSKEKGEKVAGAVLKNLRANESEMMPKGKKRPVKESVETKLSFKDMMKLVVESGGQQQIDPMDKELFAWASRVAASKFNESLKAEVYAGIVYERMGGVFEMYDVLSEDTK